MIALQDFVDDMEIDINKDISDVIIRMVSPGKNYMNTMTGKMEISIKEVRRDKNFLFMDETDDIKGFYVYPYHNETEDLLIFCFAEFKKKMGFINGMNMDGGLTMTE